MHAALTYAGVGVETWHEEAQESGMADHDKGPQQEGQATAATAAATTTTAAAVARGSIQRSYGRGPAVESPLGGCPAGGPQTMVAALSACLRDGLWMA